MVLLWMAKAGKYGGRQLPFKSDISHPTIFNFKISDLNISNFKISNLNISSQLVAYSTLLIFYEGHGTPRKFIFGIS